MRYKNNQDIVHGFYYDHPQDVLCTANSTSFYNNVFNSYYTTIGYIYEDENNRALLVSMYNFSKTTSKHLHYLINACPFHFVYVPFKYGENLKYKSQKEVVCFIADNFAKLIENDKKAKYTYTRKEDREYSKKLLENALDFCRITKAKIKGLENYKKYLDEKLNAENIKQAAQKAREAAKKKAEKTKKLIAKFKKQLEKTPLLNSINKYIFDFKNNEATAEEKLEKELFIKSFEVDRPSFVTLDPCGVVKTSQGITEPLPAVVPLLRAWKSGKNIIGLKIGFYTVLENNEKQVKIGCHNIPTANIKALADMLL